MNGESISRLAARLASGELRAQRLVEDALTTIAVKQPSLNAFITVTAETALAEARDADREIASGRHRGPLHGIPVSLKDLIDVKGVPTTAGSRLREHAVTAADAPITTYLRNAGAVLVGKTNLHEFAFGTTNEDSGWGPVRHPLDPTRSPGGSSGGSAVAVRSGMSMASVGTDTGGSVRIPAAACGVVGLKPGWGEISARGVVPLSRLLDHVGPITRCVDDAALFYDVLCGRSTIAPSQAPPAATSLTLGVLEGYFMARISSDVEEVLRGAYARLQQQGMTCTPASIAHSEDIAPVYLHLVLADAAAYHATALERQPQLYTKNVRIRLEMGRYILAEDYARARRGRDIIAGAVDRALDGKNALMLPALAAVAPPLGAAVVDVKGGTEPVRNIMLRCTQAFNLSGHPAISLPCGTTREGLPVGLQLVGQRGQTAELLDVARAVERALSPE